MIRRPPRSTQSRSSAASDVYKRQLRKVDRILDQLLHHDRAHRDDLRHQRHRRHPGRVRGQCVDDLFGLLMEKYESPGRPSWLSFWFGSFAGIVPWLAVLVYVWTPGLDGPTPPTFVYAIIVSLFVFFNIFAVNMVLQYKKVGPWRDYLFGEKAYIVLSLTAKALLAWQVFSATLVG